MKTFNFFKSCLDTLSFLLQNGISVKATGFDSKLLNNLVSLGPACYFQNHLSHYLQISLGILHLSLVFLMIKNWKCKDKETQEGVYAKTEDKTLQDLMRFQGFLYRNFSK